MRKRLRRGVVQSDCKANGSVKMLPLMRRLTHGSAILVMEEKKSKYVGRGEFSWPGSDFPLFTGKAKSQFPRITFERGKAFGGGVKPWGLISALFL